MVVFDLDGALVDSLKDLCSSVNRALNEFQRSPLSPIQIQGYLGGGGRQLIAAAATHSEPAAADLIEQIYRVYLRVYRQQLAVHTRAYAGLGYWLHQRPCSLAVGVLTNKAGEAARLLLARIHLLRTLDFVIGAGDGFALKPSSQALEHLLRRYQLSRDCCMVVGDHHTDLRSAAAVGCRRVFCEYGYGQSDRIAAQASVGTPQELVAILHRFGAP